MKRSGQQAYLASFIGLLTLLWHIHYLDITLLQAYTAPVGLYLLAIGYIRNRIQKKTDESAFTLGGTAFILLPSLVQSFGADNERYSLLLGCEGTIFIILGITINEKYYKACGVAALFLAIVSQTYQYVFALPRWLLVGIIGIVFLTVAIYLMQNKQEHLILKINT